MDTLTRIEKEASTWLHAFAEAYSRRDVAAVLALIDPKHTLLVLGSGPDEKNFSCQQLEIQLRRDFSQADQISMQFDWIRADQEGEAAWFASEVALKIVSNRQPVTFPCRFTGVLVRRAGQWLLRMGHLGLISAAQAEGQSWPSA